MCVYIYLHIDISIYTYIHYIHAYMVISQRIYWISQKCFHSNGVVGFKRPPFKILTKSQPITILRRWMGFSKADKKYFPEIACSEQQLGCHQLNLEQSPHIPYGENRRLERDWEDLGISFWRRSLDPREKGDGKWPSGLAANLEEISFGTPGSNWPQARIDCHASLKERGLALERQVGKCEEIDSLILHT